MIRARRVKYGCPCCNRHLVVPVTHSGHWVKCNHCQGKFQLPNFEQTYEQMVDGWLGDQPVMRDNQVRFTDDHQKPGATPMRPMLERPQADDPIESMMESDDLGAPPSLDEVCPDVPLMAEMDHAALDDVDLGDVEQELARIGLKPDGLRKRMRRTASQQPQPAATGVAMGAARPAPVSEPEDAIESMMESDELMLPPSLDDVCPDMPLMAELDHDSLDDVDLSSVERELDKLDLSNMKPNRQRSRNR